MLARIHLPDVKHFHSPIIGYEYVPKSRPGGRMVMMPGETEEEITSDIANDPK